MIERSLEHWNNKLIYIISKHMQSFIKIKQNGVDVATTIEKHTNQRKNVLVFKCFVKH